MWTKSNSIQSHSLVLFRTLAPEHCVLNRQSPRHYNSAHQDMKQQPWKTLPPANNCFGYTQHHIQRFQPQQKEGMYNKCYDRVLQASDKPSSHSASAHSAIKKYGSWPSDACLPWFFITLRFEVKTSDLTHYSLYPVICFSLQNCSQVP